MEWPRELLARVAADARDLGASTCSLEVRAGNLGAQAFYEALGFKGIGMRPRYYSDREDAVIMEGPLPLAARDVAGMALQVDAARTDAVLTGESARIVANRILCTDSGSFSPSLQEETPGRNFSMLDPRAETYTQNAICDNSSLETRRSVDTATSETAARASAAFRAIANDVDVVRPLILAIESSCDETAAAIVDGTGNLVADVVASQIDFHARFGGVVPEIASRKHVEAICGVCDECLDVAAAHLGVARLTWSDLDAVAVTYAPGLVGALVVGVAFAKGAAWAADKPFIGVNHLEGHLYANKIGTPDFAPPAVVSLVSGGNTLLVHMKGWGDYETLGATIDDAVGEAFDKVAKALGLGYPGGPVVSKLAAQGDPAAIPFPRAMLHSGDLRFSLSGLKTAVVTYLNNERAVDTRSRVRVRQLPASRCGRAGGEGAHRARADRRAHLLSGRRRGGESGSACGLRAAVRPDGCAPGAASPERLWRQRRHDRARGARPLPAGQVLRPERRRAGPRQLGRAVLTDVRSPCVRTGCARPHAR